MFKSQIARTFLCLALVFVLVFNIYAMPTKAAAISGTAVMIGLGAAAVVSSIMIGLGVMPGSDRSAFNTIVQSCTESSSVGAYIRDGLIDVLRYKNSGGAVRYGVLQNLIEAVRSWLFDQDVVSINSSFYSGSIRFCSTDFTYSSSVPVFPVVVKYTNPKLADGIYYRIFLFSDSKGSGTYTNSYITNPQTLKFSSTNYSYGYYACIYSYTGRSDYSTAPIHFIDCGEVSSAPTNYPPDIDWHSLLGSSSEYDITLGDVAAPSDDLTSSYADWSAGSIALPHPGIDIPGVDEGTDEGTDEEEGEGEGEEEGEEEGKRKLVYWPTGILNPATDTTDVLTQENVIAGNGTLDDTLTGDITGPIVGGITGDITLEDTPAIPGEGTGEGTGEGDTVLGFPFTLEQLLEGLRNLFFPSVDYLSEKLETIKSKYGFVESFLATVDLMRDSIVLSDAEPPVIYIELDNAQSNYGYDYGGQVAILDMRWYAAYKPTVDRLLSAFLWFCFLWKIFKKLPGYIQGSPDDVDFVGSSLPAVVNRDSIFRSSAGSLRRLK